MAKTSKNKIKNQKDRLAKELVALLPEIDEEGLVFLLKQANTLIHNMRAARLNDEIAELNRKKGGEESSAQNLSDSRTAVPGYDIEINRSNSGKNYHFIINGRKHFFDIPDTQKIITLCYRPETKSAALKFLYEYFVNERDDILQEHNVESAKSPFFEALFREVRANFTLEN
ncbi:MAG: hypothetical protein PQJ61_16795 [Spirochaetales bacterium]|uniref:Uncharacterized protein n=1 Tax=Candidatus Thalassospirochaeta sargassi TaxID=3119039 RepID=A0AAJ1ML30_9SPIO|nr:hypothetical protein [Spirochaetales bacterium]